MQVASCNPKQVQTGVKSTLSLIGNGFTDETEVRIGIGKGKAKAKLIPEVNVDAQSTTEMTVTIPRSMVPDDPDTLTVYVSNPDPAEPDWTKWANTVFFKLGVVDDVQPVAPPARVSIRGAQPTPIAGEAAPELISVTPGQIQVGEECTLDLYGRGFVTGAQVFASGRLLFSRFVGSRALVALISPTDYPRPVQIRLMVVNPDGQESGEVVLSIVAKPDAKPADPTELLKAQLKALEEAWKQNPTPELAMLIAETRIALATPGKKDDVEQVKENEDFFGDMKGAGIGDWLLFAALGKTKKERSEAKKKKS